MRISLFVFIALLGLAGAAEAATEYHVTIKDHKFEPATLEIPAGVKIKLLIENKDAGAEEFESHDLNREKIIPANSTGSVFIGPLQPGKYNFFGEFNPATAQGTIVVK